MDIVSNIFTQIFGLYFLGLLFAFAFSVMGYHKDFKYVKLWNGFWLKLLKMIGEALVTLSIPVLRQIGDKIVYVASYHLDKNKPKTPPTITTSDTSSNVPPPVTPDPTPQQNTTKQSSANPYDDPPEPEIMD
jgi:hypothetical protein